MCFELYEGMLSVPEKMQQVLKEYINDKSTISNEYEKIKSNLENKIQKLRQLYELMVYRLEPRVDKKKLMKFSDKFFAKLEQFNQQSINFPAEEMSQCRKVA